MKGFILALFGSIVLGSTAFAGATEFRICVRNTINSGASVYLQKKQTQEFLNEVYSHCSGQMEGMPPQERNAVIAETVKAWKERDAAPKKENDEAKNQLDKILNEK